MNNMETSYLGEIVLVRWLDSSRIIEWTYDEPSLTRTVHESVGYLSNQNEDAINVRPHRAVNADGDEQHVGDMVIPLCAVLSIEVLHVIPTKAAVDYELHQGEIMVAAASGQGAWQEIQRYAAQYEQDGPVEIYEVTRRKVAASPLSDQGEK